MWQWHYPSQFAWADGSDAAASLCSTLDHHSDLLGSANGIGCPTGVYRQNQPGAAPSTAYNNGVPHNAVHVVCGNVASAAVPSLTAAIPSGYGHYANDDDVLLPPNAGSSTSIATMTAVSYYNMYNGVQSSSTCSQAGEPRAPWSTYTVCIRNLRLSRCMQQTWKQCCNGRFIFAHAFHR